MYSLKKLKILDFGPKVATIYKDEPEDIHLFRIIVIIHFFFYLYVQSRYLNEFPKYQDSKTAN